MQSVVDRLTLVAEDIFSAHIQFSRKQIETLLLSKGRIDDKEIYMECLHQLLNYHVWRLCHKTFIYEFHQYRKASGYPADPTSSVMFDQYVELIDSQLVNSWFAKYPLLERMLTKVVENICSYIEEVCIHFNDDAEKLVTKGFIKQGSRLKTIRLLDSDPHNGSKIVLCLEFDSAEKVLYKPRSLEVDMLFSHLFSEVLAFEALENTPPVPKTFSHKDYGWQAFIESQAVEEEELGKSYYHLGLCAAVFSCLGATDLHDENIIFRGSYPYVIDLETSLQPAYKYSSDSLSELMQEWLSHSIANTSIIPAKLITIPHNILIGAINTPHPQKTEETVFALKNPETDAIDLAREKLEVTRETSPITLVNGKLPNPLPYQKDFLQGYSEGYHCICRKKEKIYSLLEKSNCSLRVIMRPTTQYTFILDACLFPENLVDDVTLESKVLKYVKPPMLVKQDNIAAKVLKVELQSLKDGDIPYFSTMTKGKYLTSGDFTSEDIFELTPIANAMNILKYSSPTRLLFDKRLIAEGYSEIRVREAKYQEVDNVGFQSPLFTDMFDQMQKGNPQPLLDLIDNLAVTTGTTEAETGWIGGCYGDLPVSYNSTSLISLHDMGGLFFLFEHLAEHEKFIQPESMKAFDKFRQVRRGLKTLRKDFSAQFNSEMLSIMAGSSSLDFVFKHNNSQLEEVEHTLEAFQPKDLVFGDLFKGSWGLALVLSSFDISEHTLQLLNKGFCGDCPLDVVDNGIAHGKLGFLWTQFRISHAMENEERCRQIFQNVSQFSFPKEPSIAGWCNGNAGLLMLLSEMAQVLNEPLNFYNIAEKATVLSETNPIDLSICHGVAGILQSLLFTFKVSGDLWYLELANHYWEDVLHLAKQNGFYTGEKNKDYLLGYFLGWGGLADSALLLKMYNAGISAWLPLNLSSNAYQGRMDRIQRKETIYAHINGN